MKVFFSLVLLLLAPFPVRAKNTAWEEVQQTPQYRTIQQDLATNLPDLAIPKIQGLLKAKSSDPTTANNLRTLLGEAQVRAGLPQNALDTLAHPTLNDFSPAHLWRNYAYQALGQFPNALAQLKRIDRRSMLEEAQLQIGILNLNLGNSSEALATLAPLTSSPNPAIQKIAHQHLVSLHLQNQSFPEAQAHLDALQPDNPPDQALHAYLTGRLQLTQKNRLAALATFQALLNNPDLTPKIPTALFHEIQLALADSLALENNQKDALTYLLDLLSQSPDFPALESAFDRLRLYLSTENNPTVIAKLQAFLPPSPLPGESPTLPPTTSAAYVSQFPLVQATPLALHALALLASLNLSSDNLEIQERGRQQAQQLLLLGDSQSHHLHLTLIHLALSQIKNSLLENALKTLNLLTEITTSPQLLAHAQALIGEASFALERPDQAAAAFLAAQKLAQEAENQILLTRTTLNAGLTLLLNQNSAQLDQLTQSLSQPEARSLLELERGLFLSSQNKAEARPFLASFLASFPKHPRAAEASLALAENALFAQPTDRSLAESQITLLKFKVDTEPLLEARRILVLLALNRALEQANEFLARAPDHPLAPRILFSLAQAYRLDPDTGKGTAHVAFERFLENYPASELADAARYLSALSALSTGTESAENNALLRLREIITKDSPLAHEAALALASLLIDRNQAADALIEINSFLKKNSLAPPDRHRFLILAADAANQLGDLEQALSIYQTLLNSPDLPLATRNRTCFLRGQILERLNRKSEALEAYFTVIGSPPIDDSSQLEWKWFDRCAFDGALALLENEKRWLAAVQLAENLAQTGSPRSEDARKIAERISLEQRLWRGRSAPANPDPTPEPKPQ